MHIRAIFHRGRSLFVGVLCMFLTGFDAAAVEPWPTAKPIRWIVAYPAGGGSDFLARTLAPQLAKQLEQSILIDNRAGAAGIIGTDLAAKATPDGYTMVTGDNGAMVFHPAMYKKLPYAPSDFAPVGFMAQFPLIIAVHPDAGFSDGKQLLDMLKRQPGKFNYASPGVGSPHHLAMELLKQRAKLDVVHVAYRGTALSVQDVLANQVPIIVLDTAAGLAQIRAGRLKALAVFSKKRIASLPDVPTLHELGVRDIDVSAWQGLFVPKDTPTEIVARLGEEMRRAILSPEIKPKLEKFGLDVVPADARSLAVLIDNETAFWHALIRERKLSAE